MERFTARLVLLCALCMALVAVACAPSAPAAQPAAPVAPKAAATSAPAPAGAAAAPTTAPPAPTAAAQKAAAPAATSAPAAGAPKKGGVVRLAIQTQPGSLNPVLPAELSASIVNAALFAPLATLNPETFAVEPYLAEKWEASNELKTWTFSIHPKAIWHDGKPVTADDVKFTIERVMDPNEGATNRADLANVESVEVVNEKTVKVNLKKGDAFFIDRFALGGLEIIPKHILSGNKLTSFTEFNTLKPVGSGAFKIKQVVSGSSVELEAFDQFFLGRPNIDGLLFKIVPDINQRVVQLRTGDLDWVDIEPVHIQQIRSGRNLEVINAASNRYQILDWNLDPTKQELFLDPRVRQAMIYGADRKKILETVAQGAGQLSDAYVPASMSWVSKPNAPFREYDVNKAKALLAEAGWKDSNGDGILDKDGKPFKFYILVDKGNVQREQIGLILQQQYKALGMDVDYVVGERGGRWIEETRAGTFPARLAELPIPNPLWLERIFATGQANNSRKYSNKAVDEKLLTLGRTTDRAAQSKLIVEAQEEMYKDPPAMVVFYRDQYTAANQAIKNVPKGEIKLSMPYAYKLWVDK